jgi:hypothetical protein
MRSPVAVTTTGFLSAQSWMDATCTENLISIPAAWQTSRKCVINMLD